MSNRPYFRSSIEELEALVGNVADDLKTLKAVQYELGHRDRPRARALKQEVSIKIARLAAPTTGAASPESAGTDATPASPGYPGKPDGEVVGHAPPATPSRLAVDCAHCGTKGFVSALEGVTQHLSCAACRTPFEARFAYGTLRTVFQPKPAERNKSWPALALALVAALLLFVAFREFS